MANKNDNWEQSRPFSIMRVLHLEVESAVQNSAQSELQALRARRRGDRRGVQVLFGGEQGKRLKMKTRIVWEGD